MAYQIIDDKTVQRLEDGAFIPVDPANADWRAYLEWRGKKKNVPLPPPEPPPAKLTVEQKLAAAGLTLADLKELVAAAVSEVLPAVVADGVDGLEAGAGPMPTESPEGPPRAERVGQVWTAPDGASWIVTQARNDSGQFAADDPATEEQENLQWMKSPSAVEQTAES